MITLVTGASSGKYVNFLKLLITNVITVSNNNNIDIRLIIYDLGMTELEKNEIIKIPNIIFETFNYDLYPPHIDIKKFNGKNCSYAWKPIIFYDVCEKYGGLVHWMDTRNLYSNFKNLITILEKHYLYTPISFGSIKRRTHQKCLHFIDGLKYQDLDSRSGGAIAVNYNLIWVKQFVKEWRDFALIKECIVPEGSDRTNHRQDQSILSILYYKYKDIHKFKDVRHKVNFTFHNHVHLNK